MPSVTRRRTGARDRRSTVEADVLAAVERLLADGESFTELPVGRIADAAGIGRTTFYGAFPDKATLLIRLAEAATGDLFAQAAAWVEDPDGTREGLDDVVRMLVAEHRAHAPLLRAIVETASYDPDVAASWQARLGGFADRVAARATRTDPGRPDPAVAATFVVHGLDRAIALHVAAHEAEADDAFARALADVVWRAVGDG